MLCKICRSNSVKEAGTIQGYRQNSYFRVSECGTCGASSVDPCEVDTRIYEAIYKNVERVPGYARYFSLAEEIERQADPLQFITYNEEPYFAVVDAIRRHISQSNNVEICEIGCGQGYFTYALRKAGFTATGVDHSAEAIDRARRRYGDFYFCGNLKDYTNRCERRPQLIFACEVIEHLQDPVAFVAEALESLPSGGILVLTTPNKLEQADTPDLSMWDTELPPVHLWWLTKNSFRAIGERLNCSVTFTDFTGFYRLRDGFRRPTATRQPILDEDYQLISSAPAPGRLAELKKVLRTMLPASVTRKIKRMQAARTGNVELRDNASSETIGALFTRA